MPKTLTNTVPKLSPYRIYPPLIIWLILIFAVSSLHKAFVPETKFISLAKIAHVIEYTILGYFIARAAYFSGLRPLFLRWMWIAIIFGLLYAVSDEWHQYYVPGRMASVADTFADFIGVFLGVWLFRRIMSRK